MALLKIYGNPQNDKGSWVVFGVDPDHLEREVKFRIRRTPEGVSRKLVDKFGVLDKVSVTAEGRTATIRQRVMSVEDFKDLAVETATFAWVDSENFYIMPRDDEDVVILKKHLDKHLGAEESITAGEEVCVDGRLGDGIKRYVLTQFPDLADWIAKKSSETGKEAFDVEARAQKN